MNSKAFKVLAQTAVLLCAIFFFRADAATTNPPPKPQWATADSFGVTPAINDIPASVLTGGPTNPVDAEIETGIRNPLLPKQNGLYGPDSMDYIGAALGAPVPDGAVQSNIVTPSIPAPTLSFNGLAFTDNQA